MQETQELAVGEEVVIHEFSSEDSSESGRFITDSHLVSDEDVERAEAALDAGLGFELNFKHDGQAKLSQAKPPKDGELEELQLEILTKTPPPPLPNSIEITTIDRISSRSLSPHSGSLSFELTNFEDSLGMPGMPV